MLPDSMLLKEATRLAAIQDGVTEARDRSAFAASRAADINRHLRCQICESCLKSQASLSDYRYGTDTSLSYLLKRFCSRQATVDV